MMFSTATVLSAMLAMAPFTQAHMVMKSPVPYGAPNNSPLDPSGSDFPCKSVPYTSTGTNDWAVGSSQQLVLFGSAVHSGGSCQIAVTTDKAPTKASKWKVIHSFEGGCPVPPKGGGNNPDGQTTNQPFNFTIPNELPSFEGSVAWVWWNRSGNREMYMNCGPLKVSNGASDKSGYDTLPDMAIANIAGQGNCNTKEGLDYTFPNPGKYVTKSTVAEGPWGDLCGGPSSGISPAPGGSGNGGNTGGTPPAAPAPANPGAPSQAPPAASAPPAGNLTSTLRTIITVTAPLGSAPSSKQDAASAPPPAAPTSQAPIAAPGTGSGTACSPDGSIVCSTDGKQFAICNWGKAVFQAVAAGTTCQDGKIAKRADVASTLRTVYA